MTIARTRKTVGAATPLMTPRRTGIATAQRMHSSHISGLMEELYRMNEYPEGKWPGLELAVNRLLTAEYTAIYNLK